MAITSREWRLTSRPDGMPAMENFELATVELADAGPGEVQVQNQWLSVDPYMRGRMRDVKSYVPPFQLGEPMQGGAVGTVVQSNNPAYAVGDTVVSMFGWREAFNAPAGLPPVALMKVPPGVLAPEMYLGVAGITGMTAYLGLLKVAGVKAGETVFVSGAAGAVGSVVCQLAKLKGATVIGSAGGPEKCAWLQSLGVDAVIDYRAEQDLVGALLKAAPRGIDVYFDNVGGAHLDAALMAARPYARMALCGMIEGYNGAGTPVRNMALCVGKKLRLEGFIVSDHFDQMEDFMGEMIPWVLAGKVKSEQTVDEGIENAVGAFLKLFSGGNTGKMLVKLG